jgi:hypothetical protein
MQPYYQTHSVGALYLIAVFGWYLMEVAQFFRQRQLADPHRRGTGHGRPGSGADT